jgi:hypothetical protein
MVLLSGEGGIAHRNDAQVEKATSDVHVPRPQEMMRDSDGAEVTSNYGRR